ncbi:MAG: hypothetical protein NUV98_04265 [Candidatus Roizmanbacteria bacterium]|nr:hypothetical protein [Candidatus Roizmanbacteria bacterium]
MKKLNGNSVKKYVSSSLIIVLILFLFGIAGMLFYFMSPASRVRSTAILKVGDETLYTEDTHHAKTKIPQLSDAEVLDMIVRDSVILQSGEERGYVTLNSSVFNNTLKNMGKRDELVDEVKQKYTASVEERISGTVITVWFAHPGVEAAEIAQRKDRAYDIIKPYFDAVGNNTMSLAEVAEELRTNTELATLDPAYETNTSFSFYTKPATVQIVSDTDFDQHLKQLPLNTLSDLSVGHVSLGTGELVEAVYLFGMLTDRQQTEPIPFEAWVQAERNQYTITKL